MYAAKRAGHQHFDMFLRHFTRVNGDFILLPAGIVGRNSRARIVVAGARSAGHAVPVNNAVTRRRCCRTPLDAAGRRAAALPPPSWPTGDAFRRRHFIDLAD